MLNDKLCIYAATTAAAAAVYSKPTVMTVHSYAHEYKTILTCLSNHLELTGVWIYGKFVCGAVSSH